MNTSTELEKLRQTAEEEKQKLLSEMLTSAKQYTTKISEMEESYNQQLKISTQQKDQERMVVWRGGVLVPI